MQFIVPAILPTTAEDLSGKLSRLHGISTDVQIDIVDGRYVSPATWPYTSAALKNDGLPESDAFAHLGAFRFEVDLMVQNPEEVVGSWIRAGASRITIHAETTKNLAQLVDDFDTKYGHDKDFTPDLLAFGLSLNINTPTTLIEPYLDRADYVQFMGITEIGKQGQEFNAGVVAKIASFHKRYPEMCIQVDGGVSLTTAPELIGAGVSRLVVGSALWKDGSAKEQMKKFTELAQVHGLYS